MRHFGAFVVIILNQGLAVTGVFPLNNHCAFIAEIGTYRINFLSEQRGGTSPYLFFMDIDYGCSPEPAGQEGYRNQGKHTNYDPAAALISCAPGYYSNNAIEARAALSMISDASEILHKLLDGGHSTVAGRLAGAFRNIGKTVLLIISLKR
jgi:hypothetical protein